MRTAFALLLLIPALSGCNSAPSGDASAEVSPADSKNVNMRSVEITGIAQNLKAGAILSISDADVQTGLPSMIYVDGVHSWDAQYHDKHLIIKGMMEKRDDNPVIPDNMPPGEIAQGIPTPVEQLDSARWRWWIIPEKIELVHSGEK